MSHWFGRPVRARYLEPGSNAGFVGGRPLVSPEAGFIADDLHDLEPGWSAGLVRGKDVGDAYYLLDYHEPSSAEDGAVRSRPVVSIPNMRDKPVLVPREGAEQPAFEALPKKDAVQLLLGFDGNILAPRARKALVDRVHRWIESTDWSAAGGQAAFAPIELGPGCAAVTFIGTRRPARAIDALLESLRAPPHRLREAVVVRRRVGRGGKLGPAVGSQLPKQKDYKSQDAWWKASFDKNSAAPMTEDPRGMFSIVRQEGGAMLAELRPAAIAVPGVRIVYGLPNGVEYPKSNTRAVVVTKGVTGALATAFGGRPPKLYNADAEPGRTLERIRKDGRDGYVFAISREDEMFALYPSCFRYREYELMLGLAAAIEHLRLEPVIHWLRDHCFMVNLWERKARR